MTEDFNQFKELFKRGNFKEALTLAEESCIKEASPFWLTQQAKVLNRLNRYAGALECARKAIEREPSNNYAILAAAEAFFGLKKYSEAMDYYKELLRDSRLSKIARKRILDILIAEKKWKEVLAEADREPPGSYEYYHTRIKALAGLNRQDEAIELCNKWLKEKPDYPEALRYLIDLKVKLEGLETVKNHMERMARIPSLPPIYKELYAHLCRQAGDNETASQTLAEVNKSSSDPWIQKKQAFAMAKGNEKEAIPLLEELLRQEPENVFIHSSYLSAGKRIGYSEKALNFYYTLSKLHPDAKSLWGRIRKLKKQLGKK